MASVLRSVETAVARRRHRILSDAEESPAEDRFRQKTSLDLRQSFRKRRPLRDVAINFEENPTWEDLEAKEEKTTRKLRRLKRTASYVFGSVSQKIHDGCRGPARTLATSLAKIPPSKPRPAAAPRTPRRRSGRLAGVATPTSCARMVSPSGGGSPFPSASSRLWKPARTAASRSPYGSPVSVREKTNFERDLELVSSGIRRLKRLSRAFDDVIVKEERDQAVVNYYEATARNMRLARRRSYVNRWPRPARPRRTRTALPPDPFQQR